jgi:hypothetical protein
MITVSGMADTSEKLDIGRIICGIEDRARRDARRGIDNANMLNRQAWREVYRRIQREECGYADAPVNAGNAHRIPQNI